MSRFVEETQFPTRHDLYNFLTVITAGRAGEGLAFGEVSLIGAGTPSSDLALATTVAELSEFRSGLGSSGAVYLSGVTAARGGTSAAEVRQLIDAALARASILLTPFVHEIYADGEESGSDPKGYWPKTVN